MRIYVHPHTDMYVIGQTIHERAQSLKRYICVQAVFKADVAFYELKIQKNYLFQPRCLS